MMKIAKCRKVAADAIAEYGTDVTHICPNCGEAYTGIPEWDYCDNTIDCTAPVWYVIADDKIVELY
jgi:hypothetical protein